MGMALGDDVECVSNYWRESARSLRRDTWCSEDTTLWATAGPLVPRPRPMSWPRPMPRPMPRSCTP
eukprot:scaffold55447_cov28-Tisochrysis_lutea.AAC.3